jgi:hypothetical protein
VRIKNDSDCADVCMNLWKLKVQLVPLPRTQAAVHLEQSPSISVCVNVRLNILRGYSTSHQQLGGVGFNAVR